MLTIQMMDLSAPRHRKSEQVKQCRSRRQCQRQQQRQHSRVRGMRRRTNSRNVR